MKVKRDYAQEWIKEYEFEYKSDLVSLLSCYKHKEIKFSLIKQFSKVDDVTLKKWLSQLCNTPLLKQKDDETYILDNYSSETVSWLNSYPIHLEKRFRELKK